MKRYLVAIALIVSTACVAQQVSPQRMNECNQQSLLAGMAADYRDAHQSPQEMLKFASQRRDLFGALTDSQIKKLINAVYFDERLAVPPGVLSQAVAQQCILPDPQFHPLQ